MPAARPACGSWPGRRRECGSDCLRLIARHGQPCARAQAGDAAAAAIRPVDERAGHVERRLGMVDARQPPRFEQRRAASLVLEAQVDVAVRDELEIGRRSGRRSRWRSMKPHHQQAGAHRRGEHADRGAQPIAKHVAQHQPPAEAQVAARRAGMRSSQIAPPCTGGFGRIASAGLQAQAPTRPLAASRAARRAAPRPCRRHRCPG